MTNCFEYKKIWFYDGTPLNLCDKLIALKATRIVLDLGDTETKEIWNESFDVTGYVGKTTGIKPMLILVHNARSMGGGIISTNRILTIKESAGKRLIYSIL